MLQSVTPLILVFAAIILGTDRRIIRALRENNATSPESGISLPPRNLIWRRRLRRLLGRGAVVRVDGTDLMYIDEMKWQAFRSWRRRRVVIALAILVPLFFLVTWLMSSGSWFSSDI